MFNILHFDSIVIQWYKKLTFTDSHSERRIIIKMSDFIRYHNNMSCVNVLFVHDLDAIQKRCLFAKITFMQQRETFVKDELLNLSILNLLFENYYIFVDLSNIYIEKLYIIFINSFVTKRLNALSLRDFNSRQML